MGSTYDVYVANIPLDFGEAKLREYFEISGEISGIKIMPPKNDHSKKIGFVKFANEEDAKSAAKYLNNVNLEDGGFLTVRYKPQENVTKAREIEFSKIDVIEPNVKRNNHSMVNGTSLTDVNEDKTVFVFHAESPIEFWAQVSTDAEEVLQLSSQLETLCPTQPKIVGQLSYDQIYGLKYSEDGCWYRCKIEKMLAKNQVVVRYIDYGNSEQVDRFGLVSLPTSLTNKSGYCKQYQIEGLQLVDADIQSELSKRGTAVLTDLLRDQSLKITILKTKNDGQRNLVRINSFGNGEVVDVVTKVMSSGSVIKKQESNSAFNIASASLKRIKSPFSKLSPVKNEAPSNGVQMNGHHEIEELKERQKAYQKRDQENIAKIKELEMGIVKKENQLEQLKFKLLNEKNNKKTLSSCLSELSEKVSLLRKIRKNLPSGSSIFPGDLQRIIDLVMNNINVINLSGMEQYQNVVRLQNEIQTLNKLVTETAEKEKLNAILKNRESTVSDNINHLKTFLKYVKALPLDEREANLKNALEELENEYSSSLVKESHIENENKLLEEVIKTFKETQVEKMSAIKKLQQKANDKSSHLFKAISQYQRLLHCVAIESKDAADINIDNIMEEYDAAIREELDAVQKMEDDSSSPNAILSVVWQLKVSISAELADIEHIRSKLIEEYGNLKTKYETFLASKPDLSKIQQIRKQIKTWKSKYRHKLADITDAEEDSEENEAGTLETLNLELCNIRDNLHKELANEMTEMRLLARQTEDFPEIEVQNPELNIAAFKESKCLLQSNRNLEHYSNFVLPIMASQLKHVTYKTIFNLEPCILKEMQLNGADSSYDIILKRLTKYISEKTEDFIDIDYAFMDKKGRKFFIQQKYYNEGNLKEFLEKRKPSKNVIDNLLVGVLKALKAYNKPYNCLKVQNILIKSTETRYEAVLAEPNLLANEEEQLSACLFCHDVINGYPVLDVFQENPSIKADILCFGGLMLWALHQGTEFSNNVHSDIELLVENEELKDLLRNLFSLTSDERFEIDDILNHPYFKDLTYEVSLEESEEDLKEISTQEEPEAFKDNDNEEIEKSQEENVLAVEDSVNESDELVKEEVEDIINVNTNEKLVEEVNSERNDTVEIEKSTNENEKEPRPELDGWNTALLRKKDKKTVQLRPEEIPLGDDDDDIDF